MDKNDIIDYVMHTPHNTNKAVLSGMLNQLTEGGSGGSSDFSTATVTIVDNAGKTILLPFIADDDEQQLHSILNLGISESGDYIVPLYKGSLTGRVSEYAEPVSVSGDITYLPNRMVVVTGDGTITIDGGR